MHTPPELYGGRDKSSGVKDKVWLPDVGKRGWAVLGTDTMIFQHPDEYQAYLQARVPVFLLPGASKVAERVALVEANLAKMCAEATQLKSAVWVLTMTGIVPYQAPAAAKRSRKA